MPLTSDYLDVRLMDDKYSSDNFFNLFPYYDVGEPSEGRTEADRAGQEKDGGEREGHSG